MKLLSALPLSAVLFAGPNLHAQDLAGTWQGTLHAGKDLRLEFKISAAGEHAWKATLYSIDQTPQPIPTGSVTVSGASVSIPVPAAAATFEGKLEDASTLNGAWKQGSSSLPLVLKHVTEDAAWPLPAPTAASKPMPPDAHPEFEVATIKPSRPDQQGRMYTFRGGTFNVYNMTLAELIAVTYDLNTKQIAGGPAWITTDHFDITAKPDTPGVPSTRQIQAMVKKLLAERFALQTHNEQKEMSVFILSVAKNGPKLTRDEADPNGLPGMGFGKLGSLSVHNATMGEFAAMVLQGIVLDRPVLDHTGLSGRFDFTLNWTPDESQFGGLAARQPPPADNAAAPPDLFTAMQEQDGLKLEATRAPAPVLVIDKAEKPSGN